jgi:hypothetical protein
MVEQPPSVRRLRGLTAMALRHSALDVTARSAVQGLGLAWPNAAGDVTGTGPWLAWRSPNEILVLGAASAPLQTLRDMLAPGQSETSVAIDVSQAMALFELNATGSAAQLDGWLARMVDAQSIPHDAGRCTRCRCVDVPVMLLRLAPGRMWLLVDAPLAGYIGDWLAFGFEGTFGAVLSIERY